LAVGRVKIGLSDVSVVELVIGVFVRGAVADEFGFLGFVVSA
jgi:hypothetical protein